MCTEHNLQHDLDHLQREIRELEEEVMCLRDPNFMGTYPTRADMLEKQRIPALKRIAAHLENK